jgi:hypothetical protein
LIKCGPITFVTVFIHKTVHDFENLSRAVNECNASRFRGKDKEGANMYNRRPLSPGIFSTTVTMKDVFFWDMTPCRSSKENRPFGGTYRLHLQGNESLSLRSSQKAYVSRRTAKKRASCNDTSAVCFIRYPEVDIGGPLLR